MDLKVLGYKKREKIVLIKYERLSLKYNVKDGTI